jgi:hypothetical protein
VNKKWRAKGARRLKKLEKELLRLLGQVAEIFIQAHDAYHHSGENAAADDVEQKGLKCAIHAFHIGSPRPAD